MVKCCVHCRAPQIRGSLLSFHRFPKDENRRQQWIAACGLENTPVAASAILCSDHFVSDDYDEDIWLTKRLKMRAIPTRLQKHVASTSVTTFVKVDEEVQISPEIFSTSIKSEQSASAAVPDPLRQAIVEETLKECNPLEHTPTKKVSTLNRISTVRYVNDLQEWHFSSPEKTKQYLKLIKDTVKGQKNKIQVLRVQNKRLQNRIDSMKNLLQHLREEHLRFEETKNSGAGL